MDDDAVTRWFRNLSPAGDADAAQRLWEYYYSRLVRLAHRKLGAANRRVADEEDVVLSAFKSFYQAAVDGRFPRLADREDLWKLLVTITARKASDHRKHYGRQKRGGHDVRGESALRAVGEADDLVGFDRLVGQEPSPEFAALVCEQYERLLGQLPEPSLRELAVMRLESYTVDEIAAAQNCSVRTVKRRLALIRSIWERTDGDEPRVA